MSIRVLLPTDHAFISAPKVPVDVYMGQGKGIGGKS